MIKSFPVDGGVCIYISIWLALGVQKPPKFTTKPRPLFTVHVAPAIALPLLASLLCATAPRLGRCATAAVAALELG